MAARNDTEAAVAGILVVQSVLDDEQAAAHLAVGVRVEAGAVEEDVGGAVDAQAFDPLGTGNHERLVVELPAASVQGVEVGQELAVREQVAEWLAMGLLIGEHAGEDAALMQPSHVAAGIADWVFAPLVPVGVKSVVERFDLARREELADDDEALQVEEEFFRVVHGDCDLP